MHTCSLADGLDELRVALLDHLEPGLRVGDAEHAVYVRVRPLSELNQVFDQRGVSLQIDRLEGVFEGVSLKLDSLSVADYRHFHLLLLVVKVPGALAQDHVGHVAQLLVRRHWTLHEQPQVFTGHVFLDEWRNTFLEAHVKLAALLVVRFLFRIDFVGLLLT